jgi:hypothetical protein
LRTPDAPCGFSENSEFLSAFLNIQNPLPLELQAFQQTDNGQFIAKGFVVQVPGIEYDMKIEKTRVGEGDINSAKR